MKEQEIKCILESEYEIKVTSIEKVKNTYKINGDEGYCLKVIKYQYPHFYFIYSVIEHLNNSGFENIIPIIKNKYGKGYINLFGKYAYLTKWIKSRESNYDDLVELNRISEIVGKMHKYSERFIVKPLMRPRVYWGTWIKTFTTRKFEILDFKNRIEQKIKKNDFDKLFMENIYEEIEVADKSILGLEESNYFRIMEEQVMKLGVCHHDLANHNVLINENNKINIIDFDYCILDTNIHDLGSLMIRSMKNGKWDKKIMDTILEGYSKEKEVTLEELKLIKEFIRFPQGFWQIGLQVYWEQQPWGEEFMIKKLQKYLDDREMRRYFINNFF